MYITNHRGTKFKEKITFVLYYLYDNSYNDTLIGCHTGWVDSVDKVEVYL